MLKNKVMPQTSGKLHRKALDFKISILKFYGFWRIESIAPFYKKIIYSINHIITIVLITVYLSSVFADLAININDFSIVIEDALFIITVFMVIFKLYTFKTHHNRIVKLTEAIYEPLDFLHQSSDVRIKKILKRTAFYENLTDKFSEILAIMFDFALISSLIINSGSLPVRGAFPFDTSILPFYALAVTIQIGTACITLTSVVVIDAIIFSYIRWINTQLRILIINYYDSDFIQNTISNLFNNSHSTNMNKEILNKNYIYDYLITDKLKMCFKKYFNLVSIVSEFNSIFDTTMLTQIFSGCCMLCMGCFQIVMGEMETRLQLFFFLGAAMVELFNFCWFSTELTFVSNSITHGLWSSSWEKSLSSNVKSIMIMTMTLAKNQLQINAGKFFVMSLETFITVIRTAYSFFVLLSSLNTD